MNNAVLLVCTAACCFTTLALAASAVGVHDSEGPGLLPEHALLLGGDTNRSPGFDPDVDPWLENVAWKPRVFIYHNFLTDAECDHIVRIAAPQMKRSTVVGNGGESVTDNIRTSYGTFIRRMQDDVIERVEQRVADWTQIPASHQEDLQVLRYGVGQKYGAHYDSLIEESPRVATVLLYLTDTAEGGETAFPHVSEWRSPQHAARAGNLSECARGHVAFKPRRRDALLFFSLKPDGVQDEASMHTGCPVLRGIKWTCTKWIHTKPFRPATYVRPGPQETLLDPGLCKDGHPQCKTWAASGECTKNPGYMTGTNTGLGMCREACGECTPCAAADRECYQSNRERGGYLRLDDAELQGVLAV